MSYLHGYPAEGCVPTCLPTGRRTMLLAMFAMKPYVLSDPVIDGRVHELSEFRVLVGKKRGAGASRETVFRQII